MSELEAAWLRLQLPHLADDNCRRRDDRPPLPRRGARPALARRPPATTSCTSASFASTTASAFRAALAERGVATGVHYPLALTQQPAYRRFARHACPEAEAWAAECVSLPCFPELTDDEVDGRGGGAARTIA